MQNNNDVSVIAKVSYKYSKSAMEEFFKDARLNHLFVFYADEIKIKGHQASEGRSQNKPTADE